MRSELARAPVIIQSPQRPGLDDIKKSNGNYAGVPRAPSAGRKPPQGKVLLPEFPRRDDGSGHKQVSVTGGSNYPLGTSNVTAYGVDHTRATLGSGGSYGGSAATGRSSSVPRPSSRTSAATQIVAVSGGPSAGGGSSSGGGAHAVPVAAAGPPGTPTAQNSPRGAVRPPPPGPGSILDSLTTPSVLSGGTRAASLAQRINSSSVMDYGMLAPGASTSAVRIKRQPGPGSNDPVSVGGSGAGAPGSQPNAHHYSILTHPAEQARAIYLTGPTSGTSTGGGTGSSAAAAAAAAATGRRASTDRSAAVERILSRNNSFTSQTGGGTGYSGAGAGGPVSPVLGTGLASASVAGGPVYAAHYAHQYGSQASTVYIPTFSQHAPSAGAPLYVAGSGGGSAGGGGAHYVQSRPAPMPVSAGNSGGAPLPPVSLSPSSVGGVSGGVSPSGPPPPHLASGPPPFPATVSAAAEYAPRPLQRTGSSTLSRPVVGSGGVGGGGAAATTAVARLRALNIAADDDSSSGDGGGSNSSLRRLQQQDEQPRWSGSGAVLLPAGTGLAAGQFPGVGGPTSPKLVTTSAADPAQLHPRSQLASQLQPQTPIPLQIQSQHPPPYPPYHASHPHSHGSQVHAHAHAPPGAAVTAVGLPAGSALDAGGYNYASTASSAASSSSGGSISTTASITTTSSTTKSSVAAQGSGVFSRAASTISQRSGADALMATAAAAHGPAAADAGAGSIAARQSSNGAAAVSATVTASLAATNSQSQHAAAAAASESTSLQFLPATAMGSVRSSSESVGAGGSSGGALVRAQSGMGGGGAAPVGRESGPVCGPLPDLPLVVAPLEVSPGRGCVGLQNLGNTCFMNSILQSLNAIPELVQQFLNPVERHWSPKAVVAPAYSGLVRDMMCGSHGSCVNPSAFLRKVSKHDSRWGDGRQQDSQEFLNSLMEALQAECNRITCKPVYRELQGGGSEEAQALEAFTYARTWNDSLVDDIFGGLTQSTICCHACKRTSHTFEPFLGLAVPIPPTAADTKARSGNGGGSDPRDGSGGTVSVADCLRAFVECEELQGDDSYKCEACKQRQPHSKRMQIFRPPRVLVITLKRFAQRAPPHSHSTSSSPGGGGFFSRFSRSSASKNATPVRLEPEPLDLAPFCNPLGLRGLAVRGRGPVAALYSLVAVSHHSGSLEGGHYTATARSCLDGQWYSFNDSCVRREPARPSGASSSAYVLFYRLANLPPPAGGARTGAAGVGAALTSSSL